MLLDKSYLFLAILALLYLAACAILEAAAVKDL
jgi:hypothetical protein